MRLTYRHVQVFRAVMLTGHVTRAAEALGSSQPTVSRELARLEHVLGLALFERHKGRLRPTQQALALMEEVELSFVGLERISATAQALKASPLGRLQLACLPALAHALVPLALAELARRQPPAPAHTVVVPLESPMLESSLTEQRHDLGLSERREAPEATTLESLWMGDEVVVLPAGHRWAAWPAVPLAAFQGEAFVSLAVQDPYRQQVDALFAQAGVMRDMRLESASAVSVCALVRHSLGVGIVNPLTALEMAGTGVVVRPLAVSIPYHIAAVLPAWRSEHPARAAMLQALRAAAATLSQRLSALRA